MHLHNDIYIPGRNVNNGIYVPPPDHPEARLWDQNLITAADKVRQLMKQRNCNPLSFPYLYSVPKTNYTSAYYEMHVLYFCLTSDNWITFKDSVLMFGRTQESVLAACEPLKPRMTVSKILLHLPSQEIFEKGYEALFQN